MSAALSRLPAVHALVQDPRLVDTPHALAVRAAREVVGEARAAVLAGGELPEDLAGRVVDRVAALRRPRLRGVINATGVVLHTNLGRAPLAPDAVEAVVDVARGYANVELELSDGRRGGRLRGVAEPLRALTGAEDAIAVNNGAAAVLLVLTALARGRGVVVSRGELVEIGGSFRVPDVISAGGARLVEVGTTNRTRAADFEAAVDEDVALLLRVHPSNFRQVGFTERPARADLVALARATGRPLVEDLGSGLLGAAPVPGMGLEEEAADAAIAAGVDLVVFSGDKLLGGPQAGLIVGRADLVRRCRKHPLYRALRLDKLGLAALEATLRMYTEGRADEVPARALLGRDPDTLRRMAERIRRGLPGARVRPAESVSGGGALPGQGLATLVVELPVSGADELARRLRCGSPGVVVRVARGALVIDPRTLLPGEEAALVEAVARVVADPGPRR
jgi:L-seryl-tRNA(Ser) seleniumtransferase